MTDYCTVADVLSVATVFRKDVNYSSTTDEAKYRQNTNTIPVEDVEYLITEASEMVRGLLSPRYNPDVIDAYGTGNFPPVVVYLTKVYAAMLMYERYAGASVERNQTVIGQLRRSFNAQRQLIINGALRDKNGNLVSILSSVELLKGQDNDDFVTDNELKDLYENGRTY